MVELLPATRADCEALGRRMAPQLVASEVESYVAYLKGQQGQVSTIQVDGRPIGVLHWGFNAANKTLNLYAGASLVPEDTTPAFMAAYDRLAADLGATSMKLETRRRGLLHLYGEWGFEVESLVMRKQLPGYREHLRGHE
jgi:hypothetical protein